MYQKIFLKDIEILVVDAKVTNVFVDMNTVKVVPVNNEIIFLWPDLGKYFNSNRSNDLGSLVCRDYFFFAGRSRRFFCVHPGRLLQLPFLRV
jgi:hypothetical protein